MTDQVVSDEAASYIAMIGFAFTGLTWTLRNGFHGEPIPNIAVLLPMLGAAFIVILSVVVEATDIVRDAWHEHKGGEA